MAERTIKFIYNSKEIIIQCKKGESMKDILQRYLMKIQKKTEEVCFLCNGTILNSNTNLNIIDEKSKDIIILVYDSQTNIKNNEGKNNIVYSKDIICPICGESSIITIDNYQIRLSSCDNGHETNNIALKNFKELQKINESEIICNKCNKQKCDTFQQKFYICYNCKINLCPLCESNHNKEHKILDYESKKYVCNKHGEKMISYCSQCKKNLCDLCGLEHYKKHKLIYHRDLIENAKISNLNELREKINSLKIEINNIINMFNEFISNLEIYYEINNNILKNFNVNNKNYHTLVNMKYLNDFNTIIINDINAITKQLISEQKFSILSEIYFKTLNGIILKYYKNKNNKSIRIFGENFVKNNKGNFKIIYNNNIQDLKEKIEKLEIKEDIIEVKLIQLKKSNNLSYMFCNCSSLISINNNLKWDINDNIINMSHMFYGCKSLFSLPDISDWDTSNVTFMDAIFGDCESLKSLPDISKWSLSNLHNFEDIFYFCPHKISLKVIPILGGYINEKQFLKFLEILKNFLSKKEKNENKFEIKACMKDLDRVSLHISSFDKTKFNEILEADNEYIKLGQTILSLNLEIKGEIQEDLYSIIEFYKPNLLMYLKEDKYDLKLRKLDKKLYLDLISTDDNEYKKIISCFLDNLDLEFILKSGIDITQIFDEAPNEEIILESISSLYIILKSSINFVEIVHDLIESFKEIKFNKKYFSEINEFIGKYFENKNSIELSSDQIKKECKNALELFKSFNYIGKRLLECVEDLGLKKTFLNLNLDNIGLIFYNFGDKNGLSLNLKIQKISEVISKLLE